MPIQHELALLRKTLTIISRSLAAEPATVDSAASGDSAAAPMATAATPETPILTGAVAANSTVDISTLDALPEEGNSEARSTESTPLAASADELLPGEPDREDPVQATLSSQETTSDGGLFSSSLDQENAADWLQAVPWDSNNTASTTARDQVVEEPTASDRTVMELDSGSAADFMSDLPWDGAADNGVFAVNDDERAVVSNDGDTDNQDANAFFGSLDWGGENTSNDQQKSVRKVSVDPAQSAEVPEHVEKLSEGRSQGQSPDPLGDAVRRSQTDESDEGDKQQ